MFSFLITTSKNYWYSECFEFWKCDIKNLINQSWLQNIWYINIWNNNELYDFKTKDEFISLYNNSNIKKIWLLNAKKYRELKKMITNSKKAKINYKNCYALLLPNFEDDFINKYKV